MKPETWQKLACALMIACCALVAVIYSKIDSTLSVILQQLADRPTRVEVRDMIGDRIRVTDADQSQNQPSP